METWDKVSPAD